MKKMKKSPASTEASRRGVYAEPATDRVGCVQVWARTSSGLVVINAIVAEGVREAVVAKLYELLDAIDPRHTVESARSRSVRGMLRLVR